MKYIITSDTVKGEIELRFNEQGWLIFFEVRAELSDRQAQYMLERLPLTESDIMVLKTEYNKITRVSLDLSFDAFWNAYKYKHNRLRAEALWKSLPDAEKIKALNFIPVYNGQLAVSGVARKHPDNYIKQRPWNDSK